MNPNPIRHTVTVLRTADYLLAAQCTHSTLSAYYYHAQQLAVNDAQGHVFKFRAIM